LGWSPGRACIVRVLQVFGPMICKEEFYYKSGDEGNVDIAPATTTVKRDFKTWLDVWATFLRVSVNLALHYKVPLHQVQTMVTREIKLWMAEFKTMIAKWILQSTDNRTNEQNEKVFGLYGVRCMF